MKKITVLFVGYGNMALAILQGAIKAGLQDRYHFEITGRSEQKAQDFLKKNGLEKNLSVVSSDTSLRIEDKIVFLCIKPYGLSSFDFHGRAKEVISVLAGIKVADLKQVIESEGYACVMPNTAASCQRSSSAVYYEGKDFNLVEEIVNSFGSCVRVDNEQLINASIAVSGSGLAFASLVAQALIDSGVREGFQRNQSYELVSGMLEGLSVLLKEKTPQEIIESITSPAGTTIEGLSVLESKGVRGAFIEAAHQAVLKVK